MAKEGAKKFINLYKIFYKIIKLELKKKIYNFKKFKGLN